MAVSHGDQPALAVVGHLDPVQRGSIDALATQLDHVLPHRRVLGWDEVEQSVDRLAAVLRDMLDPDDLAAARWLPVPRGGVIVLGLLAYALDLDLSRVPADRLTVVVDDTCISGSRFQRFARAEGLSPDAVARERTVFAHLHSTPGVRAAIATQLGMRAVAAEDLVDHAAERLGDGHETWSAAWSERDPDALWASQPDHVVYPWNEPDISVWNDAAGRVESGWRTVHRGPETHAELRKPIVVPSDSPEVADGSVVVELDDHVLLARSDHPDVLLLTDTVVDFWRALAETDSLADAVDELSGRFDVDRSDLATDLTEFRSALVDAGFLR